MVKVSITREFTAKPNYAARRIVAALILLAGIAAAALIVHGFMAWDTAPVCDWQYIREIGSMGCRP